MLQVIARLTRAEATSLAGRNAASAQSTINPTATSGSHTIQSAVAASTVVSRRIAAA
jgi:hypothetical protein